MLTDGFYWVLKKNEDGTTSGHRWLIADRITQNNGYIRWAVLYDPETYNDPTFQEYYQVGLKITPPAL
jgi:hypothetical protein